MPQVSSFWMPGAGTWMVQKPQEEALQGVCVEPQAL